MDNFYFLIAIVLLLIARLMKKMCEYFKLALNIVKIKFDQTTRLESWIFFNTKNLENQNNSMLCKRLNDNKKRAILAFFLKVQSFSSKYHLSRMQCHPKKSLNRWPGLLKNCTPTSHTHRFFLTKSVLLILTSIWNSIDRGSLENLETETGTILTITLR